MPRCASCHRRLRADAACPRDGWAPPAVAPDGAWPSAPAIEGFTLAEPLGRGGFAAVWAARRDRDGAAVAIKVALGATALSIERFRREADALARVGPPHVPELHLRGQLDDGRPYLVLERLPGRTLADALAELPATPDPGWAVRVARAVLAPLEAAHARSVIHRDLKPENVVLARGDARAQLLDFGLARRGAGASEAPPDGAARTRAGAVVGTPEYMAPEQIRGDGAVDARADLYAFGVLLFELLTLRPPFVGDPDAIERGHLALRPPRPSELAPVPAALEALALACLAKDPARRPGSAAEIGRALAAIDDEGRAEPAEPPASGHPAPAARLVAEGRHPAVLLFVESGAPAPAIVAAVTARSGLVARRRGNRYVSVFSGRDAADPAQAALDVARDLVARHGGRAALHLAGVTLRRRERGPVAAYGAPLEQPEAWLPPEPWSGIVKTAELERALPEREASTPTLHDFTNDAPLLGRDDVLGALASSAAAAFDGTCPALFTLIGDAGLGKSRLATEAARVVMGRDVDALLLGVRAAQDASRAVSHETEELLRRVLDAPGEAPADVAALCRDAGTAAHHQRVVRALAEGLRRKARGAAVAVIVDDAHWADDALLDALEYATLDGAGVRLWVVVTAQPWFEQLRPGWGARTQRHAQARLAPLDEAAGMQLAAELLRPAEYPAEEALRRLSTWAGGNPACLGEITRSLKSAGAVRRRPSAGTYYLATAELEGLPPSAAWQWLAARALDALPPELAACARLCAALGASFTHAELEALLDALDRAGDAGTPLDAGFALSALADRELLRREGPDRHAFRSAVVQEAIHEMLDPAHRERIHRHALAFWRARVSAEGPAPERLGPLARHAGACGERDEAAEAHLRLGDLAFARHGHAEADRRYTAALHAAPPGAARTRAHALAGRGKSRYRLSRAGQALEDLVEARALAASLGDERLQAEVLLEEATALDWIRAFEASGERVAQARTLVEALGDPRLAIRLRVAEGRTRWRQRQPRAAMPILEQVIADAGALGDYESQVVAQVMLAFQLAGAGRLDESEACFEDAIAKTTAAEDRAHLCVAYVNRVALWIARKSTSRAVEDLRRAIELARETGNPEFERIASYNVAMLLHWQGASAEALVIARRARMLEERFSEKPGAMCGLLLASVLLASEEPEQAARIVATIAQRCPPDRAPATEVSTAQRISFRMLQLVLSELGFDVAPPDGAAGWQELLAHAEQAELLPEELLELLYWRARTAIHGRRRTEAAQSLARARERLAACPMWMSRFDALERAL